MIFQERYLSQEQLLMRDTCKRYVDDVLAPFIRENREREWSFDPNTRLSPHILEQADLVGLRSLGVPEEFGGIALDPTTESQTFAIIATELARGDSGVADKLVQNWKISVLLRELAPRHLQEHWFSRYMAEPQFLMAHCLTEPRGASDRWLPYNVPEAAMDTRAVLEGDHWKINGRKQFISNGYDASLYVVYANTDSSAGMLQGTSSFLVPRDTPGLEVTRCNETIGGRFMNNGEIVFDDCRVPNDHLLAHNDALGKAGVYFKPGKIIQAAKNLGIGIAAYEDSVAFVHERVQGGRVLIKHQAVAIRIAEMATKLEAVASLLRHAALAVDEGSSDSQTLCDMVKVFASQEIFKVCQHAVELHGGYGAMLEVGVEKYFRDAAVYLHMDATVDVSNFKIVRSMFPATAGLYAGPELASTDR
ncbi:acyl-CoA dehydrogenase family protein [Ferrimicrobium acidiphilum]|uniref:acyl-CoA dehydrogenase family protein n=1 Tax=Ferrimicrobium acidiphilum TaxID=121039 RepID=UPI0023F39720|nr:acyl-CoA dehydrogenase family protein [Ferrimicrobium acidiphilum]